MTEHSSHFETARNRLGRAVENSLLVRTTTCIEATLARWFRGSRLVQWFLAEPDPEVIVIDLRETYTVGPVLQVLDWVVATGSRLGERTGATAAVSKASDRLEAEPLRVGGVLLVAVALGGLASAIITGGTAGGWLILLGVALLATRERRSAAALARTRVGRAVRATFEPPAPPAEEDR